MAASISTVQNSASPSEQQCIQLETWSSCEHYKKAYEHLGVLGKGGYGHVFKARRRDNGEEVAVKRYRVSNGAGDGGGVSGEQIWAEMCSFGLYEHPNIVSIRCYIDGAYEKWVQSNDDWKEFDKEMNIVDRTKIIQSTVDPEQDTSSKMLEKAYEIEAEEPAENKIKMEENEERAAIRKRSSENQASVSVDLYEMELCESSLLNISDDSMTDKLRKALLKDVACGIAYLHLLGFTHSDLTLDNILVTKQGRFKIADMGTLAVRGHGSKFKDRLFYAWSILLGYTHGSVSPKLRVIRCLERLAEDVLQLEISNTPTAAILYKVALDMLSEAVPAETAAENVAGADSKNGGPSQACITNCLLNGSTFNKVSTTEEQLVTIAVSNRALNIAGSRTCGCAFGAEAEEHQNIDIDNDLRNCPELLSVALAAKNSNYVTKIMTAYKEKRLPQDMILSVDQLGNIPLFYAIISDADVSHDMITELLGLNWTEHHQFLIFRCFLAAACLLTDSGTVIKLVEAINLPSDQTYKLVAEGRLAKAAATVWNNDVCIALLSLLEPADRKKCCHEPNISPLYGAFKSNNFELLIKLVDIGGIEVNQMFRIGRQQYAQLISVERSGVTGRASLELHKQPALWGTFGNSNVQTSKAQAPAGLLQPTVDRLADLAKTRQSVQPCDCRKAAGAGLFPDLTFTLLFLAALSGKLDLAEGLLARNADINARNIDSNTPLHMAAAFGSLNVARKLIERGANINLTNTRGDTPLMVAIIKNATAVAEELLSVPSCDYQTVRKETYSTPLHLAAYCGNLPITKKLIEHGAKINAKNSFDNTPLTEAITKNHTVVANELLSVPSCDYQTAHIETGRTPLHSAYLFDNTELVKILVDLGANTEVKDLEGNTPQMMAAITNRRKIADEISNQKRLP